MRGSQDAGRNGARGTSGRSGLRSNFRDTGATRPAKLSDAVKVHRAADMVREKAVAHHEKHREQWIARQYGRLLLKSAPTLALHPPGVTVDPKIALMQRARSEVAQRHVQRLHRIDRARKSMLTGSPMRKTRKIEWGDRVAEPAKSGKAANQNVETRPAPQLYRSTTAKIAVAQDRARRKAEAHLVKHQEKWTSARYQNLTAKFDFSRMSASDGQQIRDVAMEAANRSVRERHEARLQRIDTVCGRMRTSGEVRASRAMSRNLGLGE